MEMVGGIFAILILGLVGVLAIGQFVCFVLVVVKMFQNDQAGLGIATIVLSLCTGVGTLLAYVMGWVKVNEWQLKKVMVAWTGCYLGILMLGCVFFVGASILGQNANSTFGTVGTSIGGTVSSGR